MPCTTNSAHAQHTLLRGCCDTNVCPCPGGASYSANSHCPCNETVGNKSLTYGEQVCAILGTGIRGQIYVNNASSVYTILDQLDFSSITCGTFDIVTKSLTSSTEIVLGTVTAGDFTAAAGPPALTSGGFYDVFVNNSGTESCGTFQILVL
jgi:hypothetical protein